MGTGQESLKNLFGMAYAHIPRIEIKPISRSPSLATHGFSPKRIILIPRPCGPGFRARHHHEGLNPVARGTAPQGPGSRSGKDKILRFNLQLSSRSYKYGDEFCAFINL